MLLELDYIIDYPNTLNIAKLHAYLKREQNIRSFVLKYNYILGALIYAKVHLSKLRIGMDLKL